jgi:hypothetical protein
MKARQGDVAAARLVLSYAIGKPTEAENPDRLDIQEWEIRQQQMTDPREVDNCIQGVPIQFFTDIAEPVMEARMQSCASSYLERQKELHPDEYERLMQQRQTEQEPAPSTHGDNGAEQSGVAPSTNGDNGADSGGPVGSPDRNGEVGKPRHIRRAAPSTYSDNGHQRAGSAPSTNGDNGHDRSLEREEDSPRNGHARAGKRRR